MYIIHTWQFNLVAYLILSVLFNQFYKRAVRASVHDGAATIVLQAIGGLSALILIPLYAIKFPDDWRVYGLLSIACIFYAMSDRVNTTIRKHLDVSVISIFGQLSSVFLILFGLTIFREPLVFGKICGGILILSANVLLQFSAGKFRLNKYFVFALLANFVFAIAVSIDVDISSRFNLPFYIMLTLLIPTMMIKVSEHIPLRDIRSEYQRDDQKFFILTGICWALIILVLLRAYQSGGFTLITPLAATSVILNVFVATIFFGERKDMVKKFIAALVTVLGVYLTVVTI